ncbi:response regulator transcription factor [Aequorivita sp. F47161]|uniref:Response regulator transcription factor n=1 Tax=Aequorivita vitellina TaxID=2874475 RepID=A0A9X1U1T4_9FLAO|nr:response regulator transcription factor [Aequorivita vitellina]MCG2420019.1 response regulator transcription factor [Aequorivita vitellina]MCZ4317968.1 response regulator transcription factor [Aequorivita viscosa]
MITVAIAEDHQSLVDGINLLLKYEDDISVVGMANDGEALLEIVQKKQPQVVLTDIKMPKIDGIAATKLIKKEFPETKIIAFTMFNQRDAVSQMIAAGASGYLLKNSPLEEVLNAIKSVAEGNTFFDSGIDLSFLDEAAETTSKKPLLSKSEREILRYIGQGKSSSQIANLRFTAVSTVEKHRKNMMHKLGLSGKNELLRYALEQKYDF